MCMYVCMYVCMYACMCVCPILVQPVVVSYCHRQRLLLRRLTLMMSLIAVEMLRRRQLHRLQTTRQVMATQLHVLRKDIRHTGERHPIEGIRILSNLGQFRSIYVAPVHSWIPIATDRGQIFAYE